MGQINLPLPNITKRDPLTGRMDYDKSLSVIKNYLTQLQGSLNTALNSLSSENFVVSYQNEVAKTEEANKALKDFVDRLVKEGIVSEDTDISTAYQELINKIIRDANEVSKKITKAQEESETGFKTWVESEYIAQSDLGKFEKLDNCTVEQSAWAYAISFITNNTVSVETASGLLINTNTLLSKSEFTADGLRFTDNQITTTTDENGNESQTVIERPFSLLIHSGGIKFQYNNKGNFTNIGYIQSFADGTLENKIYFNNIHAYNTFTIGNVGSGYYDMVVRSAMSSLTIKYRSE